MRESNLRKKIGITHLIKYCIQSVLTKTNESTCNNSRGGLRIMSGMILCSVIISVKFTLPSTFNRIREYEIISDFYRLNVTVSNSKFKHEIGNRLLTDIPIISNTKYCIILYNITGIITHQPFFSKNLKNNYIFANY